VLSTPLSWFEKKDSKIGSKIEYDYTMTLKADGIRYLLMIGPNGSMNFINRKMTIIYPQQFADIDSDYYKKLDGSIIDGELVTLNNGNKIYFGFDCLFYKGKDMEKEPYQIRYSAMYDVINNIQNSNTPELSYYPKTVFDIGLLSLPDKITKTRDPVTFLQSIDREAGFPVYPVDGIVFTRLTKPYVRGTWNKENNIQMKWKPKKDITIDFRVQGYGPYYELCMRHPKRTMAPCPEGEVPFRFEPKKYAKVPRSWVNKIAKEGDIVEFAWDEHRKNFVPIRNRTLERKDPNAFRVAMDTWDLIQNPVNFKEIRRNMMIDRLVKYPKIAMNCIQRMAQNTDELVQDVWKAVIQSAENPNIEIEVRVGITQGKRFIPGVSEESFEQFKKYYKKYWNMIGKSIIEDTTYKVGAKEVRVSRPIRGPPIVITKQKLDNKDVFINPKTYRIGRALEIPAPMPGPKDKAIFIRNKLRNSYQKGNNVWRVDLTHASQVGLDVFEVELELINNSVELNKIGKDLLEALHPILLLK